MEFEESKEAKVDPKANLSGFLAWCSNKNCKISIINLQTKQEHSNFDGAQIKNNDIPINNWSHVLEIPNTTYLVSLFHGQTAAATLQVFDVSKKGQASKIYSYEETPDVPEYGEAIFNSRRSFLAALSVDGKIAYHLFSINTHALRSADTVKLCRKTRWGYPESEAPKYKSCMGLDIDPNGEFMATINMNSTCLISDINTNNCKMMEMIKKAEPMGRCRWSTNPGEPLLFVKYGMVYLNILDVEKKGFTSKSPIKLDQGHCTIWIDVYQRDGNLLVSGGFDKSVNIFDRRQSKIVKTFNKIQSGIINCVRWNQSGEVIASASDDGTVKLLDFKTGKAIYTETIQDNSK